MGQKPTDQNEPPPRKKKLEPKPSTEATVVEKRSSAEHGAFEKLHSASFNLGDLAKSASDQLSKAKTDAVLSIAGFKPEDIVKNLAPDVISTLAKGKQLQDASTTNPHLKLSPLESEMLAKYQDFHDKIVNDALKQNSVSATLIDNRVMIDELNESIANRYRNEIKANDLAAKASGRDEQTSREPREKTGENSQSDQTLTPHTSVTPSSVENVHKSSNSELPGQSRDQSGGRLSQREEDTSLHTESARHKVQESNSSTDEPTSHLPPTAHFAPHDLVTPSKAPSNRLPDEGYNHQESLKAQTNSGMLFSPRLDNTTGQTNGKTASSPNQPTPLKLNHSDGRTDERTGATSEAARRSATDSHHPLDGEKTPAARYPIYSDAQQKSGQSIKPAEVNSPWMMNTAHGVESGPHSLQDDSRNASPGGSSRGSVESPPGAQFSNRKDGIGLNAERSEAPTRAIVGSDSVHSVHLNERFEPGSMIHAIESAQSLIRISGSDAPYMVRPLFVGILLHEEGEKIYLSIRSSVASNRIGEGANHQSAFFRMNGELNRTVPGSERAFTALLSTVGLQLACPDHTSVFRNEISSKNGEWLEQKPQPNTGPTGANAALINRPPTAQEIVSERVKTTKISNRVEAVGHTTERQANLRADTRRPGFQIEAGKIPLRVHSSLQGDKGTDNVNSNRQIGALKHSSGRYTFGTEIALVALLASGGISRRKAESAGSPKSESNRSITEQNEGAVQRNTKVTRTATDAQISLVPHSKQNSSFTHESGNIGSSDRTTIANKSTENNEGLVESLHKQIEQLVRRLSIQPVPVFATPHGELISTPQWRPSGSSKRAHVFFKKEAEHPKDEPGIVFREQPDKLDKGRLNQAPVSPTNELKLQRPTVLVALQDTLISIAETFFHDPNLGWLIASLNSKTTKQTEVEGKLLVTLFSRQKLFLPVFEPDVVEFYAGRLEDRPNEQLVTIVEETEVDRELMSSILGGIVGENRKGERQKKKQFDTKNSSSDADSQLSFED